MLVVRSAELIPETKITSCPSNVQLRHRFKKLQSIFLKNNRSAYHRMCSFQSKSCDLVVCSSQKESGTMETKKKLFVPVLFLFITTSIFKCGKLKKTLPANMQEAKEQATVNPTQ